MAPDMMITISERAAAGATAPRSGLSIMARERPGAQGAGDRVTGARAWSAGAAFAAATAATLLLAGCAGSTATTPAAASGSAPAPPTGPVVIGKGTLDGGVDITTTGPSAFSVRTVTVPPGGTTGWHTHDGTEMSIVKSGTITLVRAGSCAPTLLEAGDALFIPDGTPHLARNDSIEPVEIVVTYLLAPDAPDRAEAPAAC